MSNCIHDTKYEIAVNGNAQTPHVISGPPPITMPSAQFDANTALAEIAALTQQITDSETNLRAQLDSIEPQREVFSSLVIIFFLIQSLIS